VIALAIFIQLQESMTAKVIHFDKAVRKNKFHSHIFPAGRVVGDLRNQNRYAAGFFYIPSFGWVMLNQLPHPSVMMASIP